MQNKSTRQTAGYKVMQCFKESVFGEKTKSLIVCRENILHRFVVTHFSARFYGLAGNNFPIFGGEGWDEDLLFAFHFDPTSNNAYQR